MPATIIRAARVLTPDEDLSPGAVVLHDGVINAVDRDISLSEGANVIDLPDATLVPGFIDLHVHGGGGFSLMTDDPEEIRSYARWVASRGVTSFLATLCAGNIEDGLRFVRAVALVAGSVDGGATVLGVNLEGPFVSPTRKGALPDTWLTASDTLILDGFVQAGGGSLKIVTLAPELPRADQVLHDALSRSIIASVGHTDADFETSRRAFKAGASHVTHAFNAMRPFHHRDPGPIGAALQSNSVTVEVIADGIHLHPATVDLLIRAFGAERITLVTDGVTPAGLSAGTFRIGAHEAVLTDGRMLLPDGTIAGSAATMDQVVANIVNWGAADLAGAVRMASTIPAHVVGLSEGKGRIAPGYGGDIVALSSDLAVLRTWVNGLEVYARSRG